MSEVQLAPLYNFSDNFWIPAFKRVVSAGFLQASDVRVINIEVVTYGSGGVRAPHSSL